ncbi:hypothetical protein MCOR25_009613 [Pyricularia grisea]|uniref:Uncharacterized protein n=1 Tax=Pyricularia grisea TaxID=148305 RepID=A0A6P8B9T9_PYRGI|nr:uncharacterized protein PgNI_03370 [Pyricularia grisea]KAI6352010.1 hypothetical protein MCOR25_009613 [Pyricularia grisea]TLD12437.1 hypothetical protein PgNI_03370 [Pyricularia grisea]
MHTRHWQGLLQCLAFLYATQTLGLPVGNEQLQEFELYGEDFDGSGGFRLALGSAGTREHYPRPMPGSAAAEEPGRLYEARRKAQGRAREEALEQLRVLAGGGG